MFSDIGVKIKIFAVVLTIIGIMSSVAGGLVVAATVNIWFGVLIAVIGSLFSWLNSFLLYGYGELIANTSEIKEELASLKKPSSYNG